MMSKNIIDYLHLYLGCKIKVQGRINSLDTKYLNTLYLMEEQINGFLNDSVKLVLRPLYDISADELIELGWKKSDLDSFKLDLKKGKIIIKPEELMFLLRREFDVFFLIDGGLAVNKITINE